MSLQPYEVAQWRPDTPKRLPAKLERVSRVDARATSGCGFMLILSPAILVLVLSVPEPLPLVVGLLGLGLLAGLVAKWSESAKAGLEWEAERYRYRDDEVSRIQTDVVRRANEWAAAAHPSDVASHHVEVTATVARCEAMRGEVALLTERIVAEAGAAGPGWVSPTAQQRAEIVAQMRRSLAQLTLLAQAARKYRAEADRRAERDGQLRLARLCREELTVLEAAEAVYADGYDALWDALGSPAARSGLPSPTEIARMGHPLRGFPSAALPPSVDQTAQTLLRLASETSLEPSLREDAQGALDRIHAYADCIAAGIVRVRAAGEPVPVLPEVDADLLRRVLAEQRARMDVESELADRLPAA